MNLQERISAFVKLGNYLKKDVYEDSKEQLLRVELLNPWFTQENIRRSLNTWSEQLNFDMLRSWLDPYILKKVINPKRVLIVMAGNVPLVGFHDLLSVLISGHKVIVKLSSNDNLLLKILIDKLISISPEFKSKIFYIDNIKDRNFDVVIATGNNNSSHYFEYYFKGLKKIIRKNRRSIAILDGSESKAQLERLGDDIFAYFGLGCRNVSKLFLPKNFDLDTLFSAFFSYSSLLEHRKYANNYDYNKAVYLMGNNKLVENGFLLMKEDKSLHSPVAMLFYEYYDNISSVNQFLNENKFNLQCVVSKEDIPFGSSQTPNLWDYADGIDTIEFLRSI